MEEQDVPGIPGVDVRGAPTARSSDVLAPEALRFVAELQRAFNPRREELLARRASRSGAFAFLPETRSVRDGAWKVAPPPADLRDRRVEITGPAERKMIINALNSGARCFMADFEDALSPTWENVVDGQAALTDAIERRIDFTLPEGKTYALKEKTAVLLCRPRGWHLVEKHVLVDGKAVSASLFDFGLYFFRNAKRLLARGTGPYFYLPKVESHLEARLWNDVFLHAQRSLGVPRGSIRATVLIETLPAAFEMDEILFELREHSAGLNAGRWDYIFSAIKKLRDAGAVLPDRTQVTMTAPFMRAYTELLVATCHKRGAHAMGGMAAFVPSRKDPAVNAAALAKVREDKERESRDGFDGTWVAHPDLVPVATEVFDRALAGKPNQVDRLRPDVTADERALVDLRVPGATVTEAGLRTNVGVGIQYVESWLRGVGAAALHNLMEDAATAEISRSQVWQWVHRGATLADGRRVTRELVRAVADEELAALKAQDPAGFERGRFKEARDLFEAVALSDDFVEFLTLPAYDRLE